MCNVSASNISSIISFTSEIVVEPNRKLVSSSRHLFLAWLISLFGLLSFHETTQAATFWTGPKVTFSKANFVDWTLQVNQDRITNAVWLTRQNTEGLFNIAPGKETSFQRGLGISPIDTEWALGTIASGVNSLVFDDWQTTIGSPPNSVNKNLVLHLITEDIYIDIKFLSWQGGREGFGGGGFSYERSTAVATSVRTVPALSYIAQAGLALLLLLITVCRMRLLSD